MGATGAGVGDKVVGAGVGSIVVGADAVGNGVGECVYDSSMVLVQTIVFLPKQLVCAAAQSWTTSSRVHDRWPMLSQ